MSTDARFIAYSAENITLANSASLGWGVFYLDSHGHQLWSHTGNYVGVSFVQMSSDGSEVVASSRSVYNGTVFYFDGRSGAIAWQFPFYLENGIANYMSLAMSSDGSYIASGGPASGIVILDSNSKVLWEELAGGSGEPVAVLQSHSLVLTNGLTNDEVNLVGYNGTLVAGYRLPASALAGSPNGSIWVAADGVMSNAGSCATIHIFDGSTTLPSMQLCY